MKKYIINNLTFSFTEKSQPFFHNIHIELEAGKIYFIQGKNGVGKSTFFSILQGTTPTGAILTGSLTYNQKNIPITNNRISSAISSLIKTVIQDSNKMLVKTMTVQDNLRLAQLTKYPLAIPFAADKHIPAIIKQFNINPTIKVQHLSGGQKQILAIIMTLQKPTEILLLDEPTAALDEKNSQLVVDFLHTLAEKLQLTIIIITHDKDIAMQCGVDQTIVIKKNDDETRTIEQY